MTHLLPLLAAAAVGLCGAAGVVVTAARRPAAGAAIVFGVLALVGVWVCLPGTIGDNPDLVLPGQRILLPS